MAQRGPPNDRAAGRFRRCPALAARLQFNRAWLATHSLGHRSHWRSRRSIAAASSRISPRRTAARPTPRRDRQTRSQTERQTRSRTERRTRPRTPVASTRPSPTPARTADGAAIESGARTTSDATDDGLECPPTSCPISPGTIVVDVTDPAGAAVPYPTFLFVGSVLYGTCVGLVDGGAVAWDFNPTLDEDGTPPYDAGDAASIPQGCASWAVRAADSPFGISDGPHTIGVGAPGYVTSSVSFVVTRSCTGASLCQDPAAAVSITLTPGLPCGNTACADDEVCVVPCCGGAAPPCLGSSPSDGGACPAGSHADGTCTADGTGGCRTEQCTPGAPYCSNDAGVCTTLGVPPMDGFVQCNCQ